jgi:galactokinase/mevalonate kinase-like predicted kinase
MIRVSLPARINVVGSPTDACEGAYATITAAVERRGGAEITDAAQPTAARGEIEVAAITALCRYVPGLADAMAARPAAIRTWTDVPATSGLGGSSVLLLAVLAAVRAFYALDARRWNDYALAEIAQRAEEHDLGVACGFADRYAPLFGGIAYLSYHGKVWHAPLGEEPYATYERLDTRVPVLSFVIATTGVTRHSGAVHGPMRARYLEERRCGNGPLVALARLMGETAWRGKIALLAHDLAGLGRQVDRNQELIDEMMAACGFPTGAGAEVRDLVAAARRAGALGAKLTGAGGGGAIFALPPPAQAERIADALRTHAARTGLASEVFVAPVAAAGLRIDP